MVKIVRPEESYDQLESLTMMPKSFCKNSICLIA
mgnify:CR=1 FL=1